MRRVAVDESLIRQLSAEGKSDPKIAELLGISPAVARRARMELGLPSISNRCKETIKCPTCEKPFVAQRTEKRSFCSVECRRIAGRYARKHGDYKSRLYGIWCHIKSRCNPNTKRPLEQKYYAGRGIKVCDEWASSYEAFRVWALASGYQQDLELDRIDNDLGYSPSNCRWANRFQQMQNTRRKTSQKTSRYKGVSWHAQSSRWRAQILAFGKHRSLGCYATEEEAAMAYDRAAKEHFREFATVNFKEEGASF